MDESKRCSVCHEDKPLSAFTWQDKAHTKRRSQCHACRRVPTAQRLYPVCDPHATEKTCHRCGLVQPLSAFYADGAAPDGRRKTCIACDKARKRTPAVRAQSQTYYQSAKGKASERRYNATAKGKAARKAYAERPDVQERKRSPQGKVRRNRAVQRWRQSAKGRAYLKTAAFRQWRARYYAAYKQRSGVAERLRNIARRSVQQRNAVARSLPATLTGQQWRDALAYFRHACAYCGAEGRLVQEHFIPVPKGGPYSASNIVPACYACNNAKRDKAPREWCAPDTYWTVLAYFARLLRP